MAYDRAKEYLARVLPWPADDEPGYINVHWINRVTGSWSGRACRSIDEFISHISYFEKLGKNDFYACMSRQNKYEEKTSKTGHIYKKAIRLIETTTHIKSLFFDLDFKNYKSETETLEAFVEFRRKTHLPYPSVFVNSGGGLQIYWTFTEALLPEVWRPLAFALANAAREHDLKADTQCTVDVTRILRVPDTTNFKYNPPLPVTLFHVSDFDFLYTKLDTPLKKYHTVGNAPLTPRGAIENSALSAGIEKRIAPPITGLGVFKECAFLGNAILKGGADHKQPMWNATALAATFMENGRALHHLMSKGHPNYERVGADAFFDRKVKEQKERNIGWPSCQSIHLTGTPFCVTCQHFHKGKSPLNFAPLTHVNGAVQPTLQSNIPLPPGYRFNLSMYVEKEVTAEDGKMELIQATPWPIYDAWVEEGEKNWLHFETERTGNRIIMSLPTGIVGGQKMREAVQTKGLMLQNNQIKNYGEFSVAFIKELQDKRKNRPSVKPLGWDDEQKHFAYGGKIWGPSGAVSATIQADDINYAPRGVIGPWREASKLVTDQKRPEFNAIVASAFGAPLFTFTGHAALLVSIYSNESGVGKTTAMKTACSVWAHPVKGMQSLNDTQNAIYNKLGKISNLPNYWDEMGTETADNFNFLLQLTSGREKDRLSANSEAKPVHTWNTMLVRASNTSMRDALTSKSNMTSAGLLRVFEFSTPPRTEGTISTTKAQGMITALDQNYGQAGMAYAEFLGKNSARIKDDILKLSSDIEQEVGDVQGERFWLANAACLLAGAEYANSLGLTDIDVVVLRDFLKTTIINMRGTQEVKNFRAGSSDITQIIWEFISEECGVRHTLKTLEVWRGRGRPPTMQIITAPTEVPYVQIGLQDGIMRLDQAQFTRWLNKFNGIYKQDSGSILRAIQSNPGVSKTMGSIGSGLTMSTPRIAVLDIDTNIITDLKSDTTSQQAAAMSANNVISLPTR